MIHPSSKASHALYEQLQRKEEQRRGQGSKTSHRARPPSRRDAATANHRPLLQPSPYLRIIFFGLVPLVCGCFFFTLVQVDDMVQNDVSRYMTRQTLEHLRQQQPSVDSPNPIPATTARTKSKRKTSTTVSTTQKSKQLSSSSLSSSTSNAVNLPVRHFYTPYWNLTCPLELSMFSGVHMQGGGSGGDGGDAQGEDYLHRAWEAREVAEKAVTYFAMKTGWRGLENRRIYLIGDSLMRQVFISLACLAWNDMVVDYAIPWFDAGRAVKMRHPNTIGAGKPHSKFEEGRVLLKNNIELIYHHGVGRLLELGEDYQSHEDVENDWIMSCYMNKPLAALVPSIPDWSSLPFHDGDDDSRSKLTTSTVQRERLTLESQDIVILNAGVHSTRSLNFRTIADLFKCQKSKEGLRGMGRKIEAEKERRGKLTSTSWPHFLYLVTGPAHFPTENGAFDRTLFKKLGDGGVDQNAQFACKATTNYTVPQSEEAVFCAEHDIPLIGMDMLPLERKNGEMHVGGGDCLHWLQPGIPDLVAADVLSERRCQEDPASQKCALTLGPLGTCADVSDPIKSVNNSRTNASNGHGKPLPGKMNQPSPVASPRPHMVLSEKDGCLQVSILSVYDLPWDDTPTVLVSVCGKTVTPGPPLARNKSRNSFRFSSNGNGDSGRKNVRSQTDSGTSTPATSNVTRASISSEPLKLVAPLRDLFHSTVQVRVVYARKNSPYLEAHFAMTDQLRICESKWVVLDLKPTAVSSLARAALAASQRLSQTSSKEDLPEEQAVPTVRVKLLLSGPYRPEAAMCLHACEAYFALIDNTDERLNRALKAVQFERFGKYLLIPAVPVLVGVLVVSPLLASIFMVGLPIFIPFVLAAIALTMGAIVMGTILLASTRQRRAHWLPSVTHFVDTPLGQRIVYDTGPRPTLVSVAKQIVPSSPRTRDFEKGGTIYSYNAMDRMWTKLLLSLAIDLIGSASYMLPIVGEVLDVAWAPTQTILLMAMYDHVTSHLQYVSFFEEILIFTDIVPSATIGWLVEYVPLLLSWDGKDGTFTIEQVNSDLTLTERDDGSAASSRVYDSVN